MFQITLSYPKSAMLQAILFVLWLFDAVTGLFTTTILWFNANNWNQLRFYYRWQQDEMLSLILSFNIRRLFILSQFVRSVLKSDMNLKMVVTLQRQTYKTKTVW